MAARKPTRAKPAKVTKAPAPATDPKPETPAVIVHERTRDSR